MKGSLVHFVAVKIGRNVVGLSPSRTQIERGTFKTVDGVWHKKCSGPAHTDTVEGYTYLPATEKYFHVRGGRGAEERAGELLSRCRLCVNWEKLGSPGSETGWIDAGEVKMYYVEAVNRVGLMELARRTGLAYNGLTRVVMGRTKYVQKAKLRKVMLALISMRHNGEGMPRGNAAWWAAYRNRGYTAGCSGCGASLMDYTPECTQCWDRRRKREAREKEAAA